MSKTEINFYTLALFLPEFCLFVNSLTNFYVINQLI